MIDSLFADDRLRGNFADTGRYLGVNAATDHFLETRAATRRRTFPSDPGNGEFCNSGTEPQNEFTSEARARWGSEPARFLRVVRRDVVVFELQPSVTASEPLAVARTQRTASTEGRPRFGRETDAVRAVRNPFPWTMRVRRQSPRVRCYTGITSLYSSDELSRPLPRTRFAFERPPAPTDRSQEYALCAIDVREWSSSKDDLVTRVIQRCGDLVT
ncbi:hypothetical protein EVAR_64792_1 [Eumeta japonica]|uniref:Uncharacterized protein n=1 Tax=Eumeta variegata TaxID=151549 RepID=A0A4C1ZW38_EUMVA|nr:hypothetical protein EVAR_64792_1 [Eumeta japonica]